MSRDISFEPSSTAALQLPAAGITGSVDGARKLALQVVRFLLTDRGSMVSDTTYGSGLMQLLGGVDPSTLSSTIAVNLQEAETWMRGNTSGNVDSEALRQITFNSYAYDGLTLDISFTILNRAGEQVSITLPLSN